MSFFSISHRLSPYYMSSLQSVMIIANPNWMHSALSPGSQAPSLWGKGKPLTYVWSAHYRGNSLEVPWLSLHFMCKSKLVTGVLMLKFTVLKVLLIQTHFFGFNFFFFLCQSCVLWQRNLIKISSASSWVPYSRHQWTKIPRAWNADTLQTFLKG